MKNYSVLNAKRYSILVLFLSFLCISQNNAMTYFTDSPDFFFSFGPQVVVGADRLFSEYNSLIDGKRVALVANHTGRLSNGTHLADALFQYPNVELKALFGMNFNIRSNDYSLPVDEDRTIDPQTGVRKFNLYGTQHKPTNDMLEDVDIIIVDIQEVGARFYEHVNILGFVMEAAAENNIEVVVLDRPNPITGLKMEGFITDDDYLFGFGAYAKIPVIHGMTMGEIAKLYNGEGMLRNGIRARLHVVEMKGWERHMWFDQTGLNWIKPSPNLPTPETMLVYTGTCLFEGVNISCGRGTPEPFKYIGAPWIDNGKVLNILNELGLKGVEFDRISFTPVKMPFHGQEPFLSGELCQGIYVRVTDRNAFEPYKTGIALLWAINKCHPEMIQWNIKTLDRLVGTRRLISMIQKETQPSEIFFSWENELSEFKKLSKEYFLY
ncbi:MAG TPA: DUF1343 domain-containing protein [Bacteroidales bacterium]|jgi:uncharacterized protein YbbC (DUF1343 family)|nr:DUF1343 domain-containing protein [Bacteroidales bacterium]HQJ82166.1 DUF1343 domain-containing protein [Bacteroidales bacterium]